MENIKLICPPDNWKSARLISISERSTLYWLCQQLGLTYKYDPTNGGKVYVGLPREKKPAADAPVKTAKTADNTLRFTMRLPKAALGGIIDGVITLNGKMYKACSGCVGGQIYGSYWVTGCSPIPPGKDYRVDLQWSYSDLTGINGRYYHILPDPIIEDAAPHRRRTEIGLHQDNGTPGTSGCIGVVNGDWSKLCKELDELAKFNRYLNLEVEYLCLD